MKKSPIVNKIWEDLEINFIIGENEINKINGVVVNVRTSEIILSVWTKAISNEEEKILADWFRDILEISNESIIEFKPHPNTEEMIKKQEQLIKEEEERIKRE